METCAVLIVTIREGKTKWLVVHTSEMLHERTKTIVEYFVKFQLKEFFWSLLS